MPNGNPQFLAVTSGMEAGFGTLMDVLDPTNPDFLGLTTILYQMLTPKFRPYGARNIDDVSSNRSALPSAFI